MRDKAEVLEAAEAPFGVLFAFFGAGGGGGGGGCGGGALALPVLDLARMLFI